MPKRRILSLLLLAAGALLWLLAGGSILGQDEEPRPLVIQIRVDSIIHPVAADFISEAIEEARAAGADALVIELATPGGLLISTEEIYKAMLSSKLPVIVYVSPTGSQAASAGFFILMAADVAAMAPGTNTGAAHPVAGDGQEISGVLAEKVEQDAAASIRKLAARHGRNEELAEAAVVESRSFTADEALENGLIDLIADSLDDLLVQVDGREVKRAGDEILVLRTAGAEVRQLQMSAFQRFLSAIAHPNIAYILMTLGGLGLYFELSNPGAILPGVVGGICLILAFFALSVLPVNYAGIALILLAMIFFIAEVKVTSYGLLTVAGLISLVLGSLMLFDDPKQYDPAIRVSLDVVLSVAVTTVLVVVFLMTMVVRAHRRQVRTGMEGLIQERGTARTELAPRGKVHVHGEIWDAVADAPIPPGSEVVVVGTDGMVLRVRPGSAPGGGASTGKGDIT